MLLMSAAATVRVRFRFRFRVSRSLASSTLRRWNPKHVPANLDSGFNENRYLYSNSDQLQYCCQYRQFSTTLGDKNAISSSMAQVSKDTFLAWISISPSPSTGVTGVTVNDTYNGCIKLFNFHKVPEPEHSARYLISKAMNVPYRYSMFLKALNNPLDSSHIQTLIEYVNKRLLREPIQYILGDWEFCGMTLLCKAPVLIPRPETEDLVDRITKRLHNYSGNAYNNNFNINRNNSDSDSNSYSSSASLHILDVGAGSGAIGLGILKHIRSATCTAIDLSNSAVSLSLENANRNNLIDRYNCYLSTFMDFLKEKSNFNTFDIIVSNPPYIPSAEIVKLADEVQKFEDIRALDGGNSGLDIIECIIINCYPLFSEHGTKELWLEVSDSHPDLLQAKYDGMKLKNNSISLEVLKYKDLYELPRFIVVKYKKI